MQYGHIVESRRDVSENILNLINQIIYAIQINIVNVAFKMIIR